MARQSFAVRHEAVASGTGCRSEGSNRKEFEIVAEAPSASQGSVYTLSGEFTGWRPGNAAKRILIGMGSGREASDIHYRVVDGSGQSVIDQTDTIRTNFYSQSAGSVGTLVHPIAQKIADRIKDAKLK